MRLHYLSVCICVLLCGYCREVGWGWGDDCVCVFGAEGCTTAWHVPHLTFVSLSLCSCVSSASFHPGLCVLHNCVLLSLPQQTSSDTVHCVGAGMVGMGWKKNREAWGWGWIRKSLEFGETAQRRKKLIWDREGWKGTIRIKECQGKVHVGEIVAGFAFIFDESAATQFTLYIHCQCKIILKSGWWMGEDSRAHFWSGTFMECELLLLWLKWTEPLPFCRIKFSKAAFENLFFGISLKISAFTGS